MKRSKLFEFHDERQCAHLRGHRRLEVSNNAFYGAAMRCILLNLGKLFGHRNIVTRKQQRGTVSGRRVVAGVFVTIFRKKRRKGAEINRRRVGRLRGAMKRPRILQFFWRRRKIATPPLTISIRMYMTTMRRVTKSAVCA